MDDGPGDPAQAPYRSGFVALAGRTNVGKSTITNALVGEKVAIVSPRPQTTRRRILGIRTTATEQAVFVDTPGIHAVRNVLGRQMVETARRAIPDADVVLFVVDVSRPPCGLDRQVAGMVRASGRPVVIALNKSDRLAPEHIVAHTEAYAALAASDAWTLTIATAGHNLDRLWALVAERLPPGPACFPADQRTDQTERMLVAELVREAALCRLFDEVPHGIDVVIEDWREREDGLLTVSAVVVVERVSHRAIVIGHGGTMIRAIGSSARRAIEALLDRHVFLALEVKTRAGWRARPSELRRLGYD